MAGSTRAVRGRTINEAYLAFRRLTISKAREMQAGDESKII